MGLILIGIGILLTAVIPALTDYKYDFPILNKIGIVLVLIGMVITLVE